jgi:hypothetical protein
VYVLPVSQLLLFHAPVAPLSQWSVAAMEMDNHERIRAILMLKRKQSFRRNVSAEVFFENLEFVMLIRTGILISLIE